MSDLLYLGEVVSLAYDRKRCVGCGMCVMVCPHAVFALQEDRAHVAARHRCMECGACMRNCPTGAITVETGEGCVRSVINELLGIEGPCC